MAKYADRRKAERSGGASKTALILSVVALCLLAGVGIYALLSFRQGTLGSTLIRLLKVVVVACAGLSVLAVVCAFVAFFSRRQRKGAAIPALILALLLLVGSGSAVWAYQYMFSRMQHDAAFKELSAEELCIETTGENGEIVRESTEPSEVLSYEEITGRLKRSEIKFDTVPPHELPKDAAALMRGTLPDGKSYLFDSANRISNYLLFGIDQKGAADAIVLCSVDRAHHKVKLLSISRDTYALIPIWGAYAKLGYAYTWGGPQLAISTINRNFYLNIRDYIAVDMEQLEKIIDYAGGVDVELNADEVSYLRNHGYGSFETGRNHLEGFAAVGYARTRHSTADDTEINRTNRQREVLVSLMQSVLDMPATSYPYFVRNCLGMCTTSFDAATLTELALEVAQGGYSVEQQALLEHISFWGGVMGQEQFFYTVYDLNRASDYIYRYVYENLYISGYQTKDPLAE